MPILTLTTDFGDRDGFTGAMKGVIAGICPDATVVDIAHGIPAGDILHAAWVLRSIYLYYPPGTVHVVVVDPGVGGSRRAVVLEALGQWFVAPDNGVLAWVVEELRRAEEPARAWEVADPRFRLDPPSRTFHGRDVFAPAGAFLAAGVSPEEFGPPIPVRADLPGGLSGGPVMDLLPGPDRATGEGHIIHIDRFGNAITTIAADRLPAGLSEPGGSRVEFQGAGGPGSVPGMMDAYAAVGSGEALALIGSGDLVEIAVNGGSAAATLGLRRGDRVVVRRA